jgi:hypothetical protein
VQTFRQQNERDALKWPSGSNELNGLPQEFPGSRGHEHSLPATGHDREEIYSTRNIPPQIVGHAGHSTGFAVSGKFDQSAGRRTQRLSCPTGYSFSSREMLAV